LKVPEYIRELIEQIAFVAREDKRVDKRSGVSQRLSISCMENAISSAEQRAIMNDEQLVVPRVSDIYAAMPAITGKIELEYEGEVKGADAVAREIIRQAIARTYDRYFYETNTQQIQQWFDLGGEIKFSDLVPATEQVTKLKEIQGIWERLSPVGLKVKTATPEEIVSAAEFLLEGLYAHHKIGRSEERGFTAPPMQEKQKRAAAAELDDFSQVRGGRRGFN
jgi:magnesium chelatase subunit I